MLDLDALLAMRLTMPPPVRTLAKPQLHPRNQHRNGYDFAKLTQENPQLAEYVKANAYGDDSIDFANPKAVKALNQALLHSDYAIQHWDIPAHYLCPPIPGRADYIHNLADLIATHKPAASSAQIRVLDIGTGANLIYPLIGQRSYDWQFVAVDIDKTALANAERIIQANPNLAASISLRHQTDLDAIFKGVIHKEEQFTLSMCNPPFHASLAQAHAGNRRKWQQLGKATSHQADVRLNFGGQSAELYCAGGEAAFIERMIAESVIYKKQVSWFTTLVSKAETLPKVYRQLKQLKALQVVTMPMAQGQKQSRLVAWRFA
jgi:23S rRNA (adenine1618-N6)-methyltransferase